MNNNLHDESFPYYQGKSVPAMNVQQEIASSVGDYFMAWFLGGIFGVAVLFLVIRAIVLWYWKIDKIVDLLSRIEQNTGGHSAIANEGQFLKGSLYFKDEEHAQKFLEDTAGDPKRDYARQVVAESLKERGFDAPPEGHQKPVMETTAQVTEPQAQQEKPIKGNR